MPTIISRIDEEAVKKLFWQENKLAAHTHSHPMSSPEEFMDRVGRKAVAMLSDPKFKETKEFSSHKANYEKKRHSLADAEIYAAITCYYQEKTGKPNFADEDLRAVFSYNHTEPMPPIQQITEHTKTVRQTFEEDADFMRTVSKSFLESMPKA
jgi:hypothetical protein